MFISTEDNAELVIPSDTAILTVEELNDLASDKSNIRPTVEEETHKKNTDLTPTHDKEIEPDRDLRGPT